MAFSTFKSMIWRKTEFKCGVVWTQDFITQYFKLVVVVCIYILCYCSCYRRSSGNATDTSTVTNSSSGTTCITWLQLLLFVSQNKLEDELKQIENKFEERKRKIAQEQENFNTEIKKVCNRYKHKSKDECCSYYQVQCVHY